MHPLQETGLSSSGRTQAFEVCYRGSNPCGPAQVTGRDNMKLPELPKGYNRKEAKIDGAVADWFLKNHPRSVLLEVKVKGGALKEHQRRLLKSVGETGEFKYKFRDGGLRTPLDYVILKDADAVLATCDGRKCECVINGEEIINIKV